MAFIPEDGTGLPDANSLVSVAYADDYFTLRDNQIWLALDNTKKEAALVKATDFMEGKLWIDITLTDTQSLDWPRSIENYFGTGSGQDDSTMPTPILQATCEYGLEANAGTLYQNVNTPSNIKSESKGVGTLSKSVSYLNNAGIKPGNLENRYGKPEVMIQPYLLRRKKGFVR